MKRIISGVMALTLLASLGLAGACTGDVQAKTGTIEVRITDAPPGYDIETIDITFSEVKVHKAGTDEEDGVWEDLVIAPGTFDLLELEAAGLEALLAEGDVATGKYTQLRVVIDTIVVTLAGEGEPPEVILPSGELKFVRPFEVIDGETTILLLDFDADKSLTVTGNGTIIVKPVVKLLVSGKGKPNKLGYSLEATVDATAELSEGQARSGSESAHLQTTGTEGTGDEARIVIPLPAGTILGDIESISWWEYNVAGYPPHVDIMLDFNDDDVADDSLVFEYAYNSEDHYTLEAPMPYGAVLEDWFQTFSDDGSGPSQIGDSANGWLSSGPPGPLGDPSFIYYTLAGWKAGVDVDNVFEIDIDSATEVIALEIEVDNWVVQSEAYVDDIEIVISGVTYTIDI